MRVVLDTNVVASALLWGGTPERLIELAGEGALELITRVDAIVSGDDDLHALGNYQGIPIITAAEALVLIVRNP